ncbi:response regulator transcription factor [Undibacterium sp. RTI2.1]|uniref:response regulator transcription factor n=1 Tax=unclassified Undibacterium TaxID=2630295 RepID=UPI002AB3F1FD|nr:MULTISPECIES: response regulator transcription factor [unclassified Undibacterium]MDY7539449.1 response regulator transcription factor [Undibacterium sp. 5I1]MEB0029633.1 response regulator transcription factor [Undibacterium sp. RTI2.1]MEB0116104.1 response regulator transcription factor [Undibacterium sp. RTI2.2]MEB0230708.1 response regulator transcription factor [Undibacterium sp. 10I3]MEB0259660.1 response regulator transcription factor [Undibacterium sp. 5I1]
MTSAYQVLLVEDDPMIARTLMMGLRYEGFELMLAASIAEANSILVQRPLQHPASPFDLIMLDVGLPDGDGISLCRQLRASQTSHRQKSYKSNNLSHIQPHTPILILSARTDEATAVAGIDGGADDYIRKPCGLLELAARMRRLLKPFDTRQKDRVLAVFGGLSMDLQRRTASVNGTIIPLGKKEYEVLLLLVRAAGDAITREQILDQFQESSAANDKDIDHSIYDRTIDSHLSHLRRKLKDAGSDVRIVAIYGVGYKLESA